MARRRGMTQSSVPAHRTQSGRGDADPRQPDRSARFGFALLAIIAVALVLRLVMLAEYWRDNPFARMPVSDGEFYWDQAERIASGDLIGATPFLSAPLYPHLLGLVRALGGGLLAVYMLQIGMHLLTAALLAWIARRRFGDTVALIAVAVFLLTAEPAIGCFRVLSNSVQLLLVTALWASIIRAQERPSPQRWAAAGVSYGLLCLANASLVLIGPLLALWIIFSADPRSAGVRRTAVFLAGWAAALAPATAHNLYVCGELIPISTQGGLTLRHGNSPGARGTYTAAPGVTTDKNRQHRDAFRVYRQATGEDGNWREVDRYFRRQVFEYWRSDPSGAILLTVRKAYWFLTARHYGDIHVPTLEAAEGMDRAWHLAPLATAWLIPLAGAAACMWIRRWRTHAPELIMMMIPLVVVMGFWYSPRYRLPIIPVVAVGTAWLAHQAWATRTRSAIKPALVAAVAVALALQVVNSLTGFDSPDGVRRSFHNQLGEALAKMDRRADALKHYRRTLRYAPHDATANGVIGAALMGEGDLEGAIGHLQRSVEADQRNAETRTNLAGAYARMGRFDLAAQSFTQALELDPDQEDAHFNLAGTLLAQDLVPEAVHHYREVLRINPDALDAWLRLGDALARMGDRAVAVDMLKRGIERARAMGRVDAAERMEHRLQQFPSE